VVTREQIRRTFSAAVMPVVWGLVVIVGGLFLRWMTVRGNLHLGLVVMILTVFLVDWFLERTTIGFELRTVGHEPGRGALCRDECPLEHDSGDDHQRGAGGAGGHD